jgi:HNH endonuclease
MEIPPPQHGNRWVLNDKGYLVDRKGIKQHRVIWEIYFGKIPKGYVVHHKNGIKHDNRIENLECMPHGAHSTHHHELKKAEGVPINCPQCGKAFASFYGKKYCSRKCKIRAGQDRWKKTPQGQAYMREYQKVWQKANPEKLREYEKRYAQTHPEQLKAKWSASWQKRKANAGR